MQTTYVDSIPQNVENITKVGMNIQTILPGAKAFRLKGYSDKNPKQDYAAAKTPVVKWQDSQPLSEAEITEWISRGGWIGATIPDNRFIIDIDDHSDGDLLKELLEGENVHHHCIHTVRGKQFVFSATQDRTAKVKQISNHWSAIGLKIDTRAPGKGYIVFPTPNTEGRVIATTSLTEPDELPEYLHPVWNAAKSKDPVSKQLYEFPLPMGAAGGRNNELFEFTRRVWSVKGDANLLNIAIPLIYQYFITDKQDFEFSEVESILQSVTGMEREKQEYKITYNESLPKQNVAFIPLPFKVIEGSLYKEVESKEKNEVGEKILMDVRVCRHAPDIKKAYRNIEKNQLYYDLEWVDRGRVYTETISAGSLATKKDLLKLADMSLGVNDINARDLISYLDKYVSYNELDEEHLVERLGHVKNGFIHPLASAGVKILPPDVGERQYLEAFKTSGTSEEWIEEVFERIKDHPKVLIMVLASFTSVILKDLKLEPFIIDMAGVTSEGKTTALKVAASVWGTEHLVGEWNLTKVAAERKAAFLNSFPLMLDDTRKANPKYLQEFIYQFSSGRSKGRGSVEGSQEELTWNNLMLSTGEDSLLDYAERAGGVAARILPLNGLPFEDVDYKFFNEIYGAIEKNYGAIGLEFLKHWKDKKKIMLPDYQEYNDLFQKKAKNNKVISRISRHYAALVYTGKLLNVFFGISIDIRLLSHLFDEINEENKATDKPMQLLENMLSDLDSDRGAVYGEYLPHREIKAVYKDGTLFLLPNYLKEFLKSEQSTIRSEWLRREITIERMNSGKVVDYQQIKHGGKKFRGVAIQPHIVTSLGFDFEESSD